MKGTNFLRKEWYKVVIYNNDRITFKEHAYIDLMYLIYLKKCLNNEIEDELCDSQVFKLGLEAIRKIKDNESQRQDISLDKVDLSENMEPIMPRNITDLLSGPNIGKKSQTIYVRLAIY